MKPTKKRLQEMYKFAKELYDGCTSADIYDLKRIYNDIADEFWLDIAFWIDWNEYGWDDEIYCFIHINCVGSLVFNWGCNRFTDEGDYKEAVDYILELEDEWAEIKAKLLNHNQN